MKPYDIRTHRHLADAVATELPDSITEPDVAENVRQFHEAFAIPADSVATWWFLP